MARLVAAFGSSHSIMLVSQREDWQHGFRAIDPKNPHYYDRAGNKTDYAALLAAAPADAEARVTPERMGERWDQAEAAMDALRERIAAARLDVLIVVGDDQTELFRTTNNPAFAIYYGQTIRNAKAELAEGDGWYKKARMARQEPGADRDYPVKSDMAKWLIRALCDRDFDIAAMDGLERGQFEGHAFQFVHRRLLKGTRREVDVVFPGAKVAVFVDGCFWHGCPDHGTWPRNNAEFWRQKIEGNVRRDRDTDVRLEAEGWTVVRVWEHEAPADAAARIADAVERA